MSKVLTELIKSQRVIMENGFTPEITIIGLGYVGLPLAVEFAKKYETCGFDVKSKRIGELQNGIDHTLEVSSDELKAAKLLKFTCNPADIADSNVYIVTVPTPIDKHNSPDLKPLHLASETVGRALGKGNIVIYESTVFPGCTEEECVPILEKFSGLKFNEDFFCGYSPERINPGDKKHTLTKILKVTSGSTPETADRIDALYGSIISAGTYKVSCIKVAEAAKVIENSQRDLNIAFVNELAKIFNRIGIDTLEVLEAAGTKWNFLPFRPGLVGGHCIGVDPYYLTHKAQALGYRSEVILAGRRTNDGMGQYVATEVVKLMIRKNHVINNSKVLVLGLTFKENCPDIRNSRVIDVVRGLEEFGCRVDVHDPWADAGEVKDEYGISLTADIELSSGPAAKYDAVVLAVAHDRFKEIDFSKSRQDGLIIYDIKDCLPREIVSARL